MLEGKPRPATPRGEATLKPRHMSMTTNTHNERWSLRLGRGAGRAWRGYLRREQRVAGWLVTRGVPAGAATADAARGGGARQHDGQSMTDEGAARDAGGRPVRSGKEGWRGHVRRTSFFIPVRPSKLGGCQMMRTTVPARASSRTEMYGRRNVLPFERCSLPPVTKVRAGLPTKTK